jgi:hypothetical protein
MKKCTQKIYKGLLKTHVASKQEDYKKCLDPKCMAPQHTIKSSTLLLELETWVVHIHKIIVGPHHRPIDNAINHFCSCDKEFATFEPCWIHVKLKINGVGQLLGYTFPHK